MRARVLAAAGVCALASLFDQTHKIFVPGREFDAGDLLFDFAGYALAMLLVFGGAMTAALAINRLRKHNGAH